MRGAPRALGQEDPAPPGPATRFRAFQLGLSGLHLGQAILVLSIGADVVIDVTNSDGSPLFGITVGVAIATYFLLATLSHGLGATLLRGLYEADLARGVNRMRWVEYSLSATIMMVLIALYAGVTDIVALSVVAVANVAMILCGWRQEVRNPPDRRHTVMRPFWAGVGFALVPWVIIAWSLLENQANPDFVVAIFVSLFLLCGCFGLNQWLQYREVGQWTDYLYAERTYLVLSLVAKTALAWQIVAGSLLV